MSTTLYVQNGSLQFGIYFYRPGHTTAITVLQQVLVPDLKAREKLIINGHTTVSCLANNAVGYPGWNDNTFTAAALFMSRNQQGTWLEWPYQVLGTATGEDIHNGKVNGPMDPYYNHDQTMMHEIKDGEVGDWWIVFCAWCSCASAAYDSIATNQYLWVISPQTRLQVMRFTDEIRMASHAG